MKRRPFALRISGALLFSLGVLLQLSLSAAVSWGELEARLYTSQTGTFSHDLKCPIMLSPVESGTVTTSITNTLEEDTSPVITADISSDSGDRQFSQTLILSAHETRALQWKVDASNIWFGRLILVNISQAPYRDLQSSQGACGIFILSLLGLSGRESFELLFVLSFASVSFGAYLWLKGNSPLDDSADSIATASGVLAGFTTAALLAALVRWWGLILFLDSVALITSVVIITEFVLFPGRTGNH